MRPWTTDVVRPQGRTLTVKRCCNGCGRKLGDVTDDEIDAAIGGGSLPDVRDECWLCRGDIPQLALSLTRPWGWHVLRSNKQIENRTWTTNYRGPLLIHDAKSWSRDATLCAAIATGRDFVSSPGAYPTGISGVVDVVGCCTQQQNSLRAECGCGPWAMVYQAHWLLANPIVFGEPIPCRGAQKLWSIDRIEGLREQVTAAVQVARAAVSRVA